MFSKTLVTLVLFAASTIAVSPCTPDDLNLHGITGGHQTAPYSRWESVADTGGKEYHIFDKSDSTEPLCVFESSLVPSLNRRDFVPRGSSGPAARASDCLGDPCTNAAQCIAVGCAQGCSTWWTPGWPGNAGQGFNSACIG